MDISEVRIRLVDDKKSRRDKLQAFCSVTIGNQFVVRDLKIIGGSKGMFVAMPSRKLTDRCPKCGGKNHLRAAYCNDCGHKLRSDRVPRDARGRARLHADIAHPINSPCRSEMQRMILEAYQAELKRSEMPGYVPQELHDLPDDDDTDADGVDSGRVGRAGGGRSGYTSSGAAGPGVVSAHSSHSLRTGAFKSSAPEARQQRKDQGEFGAER